MARARYDVIVAGLGAVGSAACYHAALKGSCVLGLERFAPAHSLGSSSGGTRLIRRAYHEHADYVPLLDRSYALWDRLGSAWGQLLLHRTGLLTIGTQGADGVLARTLTAAARFRLPVEELSTAALQRRFPRFRVPEGCAGAYDPDGGYLLAEQGLRAHCDLAAAHGAELRFEEPLLAWSASSEGVVVTTTCGSYEARGLILAAGAWSSDLLNGLAVPLALRRLPQAWYAAGPEWRAERGVPCFLFDLPAGRFSGTPALADGRMKVLGPGPRGDAGHPDRLDRRLHQEDLAAMGPFLSACLPGVRQQPAAWSICLCTMTPDENFVIDRHPRHDNVVFAAGLSGHGFKFAPVIGEVLADLLLPRAGWTEWPIDFLRLRW